MAALAQRLGLVLDRARLAADHVGTLLMASRGGVASGPKALRGDEPRGRMGTFRKVVNMIQRPASGHSLHDQLRRARLAVADLDGEMDSLDARPEITTMLGLPEREQWALAAWIAPKLDEVGTRQAIATLVDARDRIGTLITALTALDGRIRLARLRLG